MKEYEFEVTLKATVRVNADNAENARQIIQRESAPLTSPRVQVAAVTADAAVSPVLCAVNGEASLVDTNEEQRLYVIPCGGGGYTCLGFDVCEEQTRKVTLWLASLGWGVRKGDGVVIGTHPLIDLPPKGTLAAYRHYKHVMERGAECAAKTGKRCEVELTPEFIGKEGKLVTVVDAYGEERTFRVGKSCGWMPIHLEIDAGEDGGGAVHGAPFKSVKFKK